ncbi:MAG TPA: ABC transporter substrate-binding protein [Dehalococcoidia bacterium]|nr:ABC transporter substrate-binding protein [Dehalococcoidia bacterium]
MSDDSYWQRFSRVRASRRRALGGAAAVGLGAVALASVGCGGGGDGGSGGGPIDASGLLGERVDTTKQARPGGTFLGLTTSDVTSFDPLTSPSFTTQVVAGWVYSRILKVVPGYKVPSQGDVEGDLAESYEVSPDKLVVTLKLRPNAKWDARAPTNGRAVTADDVVFSWNRFASSSPYRGDLAYTANKDAPIESITAVDANTLRVKLAFPDAAVITMLASSSHLFILPAEADGKFDPKGETRGSSAWFLEKYQPSTGFTYAKNPNWYRTDRPFINKYEYPIVSEYAAGLSQFRAGNVYSFGVRQEDVLQTKRDINQLLMLQGNFNRLWYNSWFGYEGNSPFKDERVRQAWSISIDRDLWIDTFGNTEPFLKAGLPVEKRWHSHFPSGIEGWWVDPQDQKTFGPNAKYFHYDPAEAKKLLAAAGYPNGVDVNAYYISTSQYGTSFPNQAEVQVGFAREVGFRVKIENPDYQTEWLPKYYYGKGAFNGIAIGADNPEPDMGVFMFARFHPQGPRFKGFDPSGSNPAAGDPAVTKFIQDIRSEFDTDKRKAIAKAYQQYMAKAMWAVPFPGQARGFTLDWPVVGNAGVFLSGSLYAGGSETAIHIWIDDTKPPIAKG